MTPRQRRVHLAIWLVLAPTLLALVVLAALTRSDPSPARAWPTEVSP